MWLFQSSIVCSTSHRFFQPRSVCFPRKNHEKSATPAKTCEISSGTPLFCFRQHSHEIFFAVQFQDFMLYLHSSAKISWFRTKKSQKKEMTVFQSPPRYSYWNSSSSQLSHTFTASPFFSVSIFLITSESFRNLSIILFDLSPIFLLYCKYAWSYSHPFSVSFRPRVNLSGEKNEKER